MGKIIKLDRHIADLIAAGEVVERPASVVKELVENAVDAGADAITVEIRRGGLDMIRVTDNGSGIDPEDIPTAFLRHATSKIRRAEDLDSISTLGFRGEALASIAAVSKVAVFTRVEGSTAGYCYEIEGGEQKSFSEAGCPTGTTVVVNELFYNTPARMKFVKKDATEAGHIQAVVRKAALARPDISFKLIRDGEEIIHTPGDNSLLSAIYCTYGESFVAGLEKVSAVHEGIRVTGYVSRPTYSQGNRTKQEFFVNARPVRARIMTVALEEAYKNRMMVGRYPACVLLVDINPALLDVNVHPTKSEVKFAYEKQVFDAVYLAVKDAVDSGDSRAAIHTRLSGAPKFDVPDREYIQTSMRPQKNPDFFGSMSAERFRSMYAAENRPNHAPAVKIQDKPLKNPNDNTDEDGFGNTDFAAGYENAGYDNAGHEGKYTGTAGHGMSDSRDATYRERDWSDGERGGSDLAENSHVPVYVPEGQNEHIGTEEDLPKWKVLGEAFETYIMVEDGDDILFIDKHAAHERMLFNKLLENRDTPVSQYLLEPAVLHLEREDFEVIVSNGELLAGMGFELDEFGGSSIIVRALPEEIDSDDAEATLQEIAESLRMNRRMTTTGKREELYRLVACKAALKAGSKSSYMENYRLAERVLEHDDVRYCPHGRPIVAALKRSELEKRFGRS